MANVRYTISESSIAENFTARLYQIEQDASLTQVDTAAIPAPHNAIQVLTFTAVDKVTHELRIIGDTSGIIHARYQTTPQTDLVNIFDPIRFVIGDGQSGTPVDGDTQYFNSIMTGFSAKDYIVFIKGAGPLQEGYDIETISNGFELINGLTFQDGEQYTIDVRPSVIQIPVNDSVVGKLWGATPGNSEIYSNVLTDRIYDPNTDLRKIIRLGGANAIFRFSNTYIPASGYVFFITNYGSYGSLTPVPKVVFENALVAYGNGTLSEISVPLGQSIVVSWDGTWWNLASPLPSLQAAPKIYVGRATVGDVDGEKEIDVTFPNFGYNDYNVQITIISSGSTTIDNRVFGGVKDGSQTNTKFRAYFREINNGSQNISIYYQLTKTF